MVLRLLAGMLVSAGLWAQLVTPPPYGTPGSGPGSGSGNSTICNASASATVPTCPGVPVPTSLTGLTMTLVIQTQTSGAPATLNVAGLGAKSLYYGGSATSAINVIPVGTYQAYHDGTQIQVQANSGGSPGGSTNDIQTNLGGGLFGGTAGQFTWVPSAPGIALAMTNPTQGADANNRRAASFDCTTTSATSNPNFSDENCFELSETANNGQALYGNGTNAKKTFLPFSLSMTSAASGQRILFNKRLDCYGMSDCAGESTAVTFAGGPVAGDEAQGFNVVSTLKQQGSLTLTTLSGSPARSSCNTTLTQNVTASITAQTVTVASSTGCLVNDWVVLGQEAPTGTPNESPAKITAVAAGSITAVIVGNYSSGGTVTPATVVTVSSGYQMGQDRVLVNLSGTSYSTGTVSLISGHTYTGSGTTWASNVVGGSSLVPGCVALTADTYSGSPFDGSGVQGPLKSWFQIQSVASATGLNVLSYSVAGNASYHGLGPGAGGYTILPCAKILLVSGTTLVLETNSFTWTNGDAVEQAINPYPDVTAFEYYVANYVPAGTYRAFMSLLNTGARSFTDGFLVRDSLQTGGGASTQAFGSSFTSTAKASAAFSCASATDCFRLVPSATNMVPRVHWTTLSSNDASISMDDATGIVAIHTGSPGANRLTIDQSGNTALNGATILTSTVPFPNAANTGSLIASDMGNATSYFVTPIGSHSSGGTGSCATVSTLWPVPGVVRNPTATISSAVPVNGGVRTGILMDCFTSSSVQNTPSQPGGVFIPPNSAAGGYTDLNGAFDWWHAGRYSQVNFSPAYLQGNVAFGGTAPALVSQAAEFVADSGYWTMFSSVFAGLSASTTANLSIFGNSGNASTKEIPIPYASTVQNLAVCVRATSPTADTVFTVLSAGVATGVTVTIPGGASVPACAVDVTHTASVTANSYISLQYASGASTQIAGGWFSFGLTPTSGNVNTIAWDLDANSVSTTKTFFLPGGVRSSTTEANIGLTMPFGCTTVSGLNVYVDTASGGGITATVAMRRGVGSTGAMADVISGTFTTATGVVPISGSFGPLAAGDRINLSIVTGSGSTGVLAGASAQCQP